MTGSRRRQLQRGDEGGETRASARSWGEHTIWPTSPWVHADEWPRLSFCYGKGAFLSSLHAGHFSTLEATVWSIQDGLTPSRLGCRSGVRVHLPARMHAGHVIHACFQNSTTVGRGGSAFACARRTQALRILGLRRPCERHMHRSCKPHTQQTLIEVSGWIG